jgi:hypothetical protein
MTKHTNDVTPERTGMSDEEWEQHWRQKLDDEQTYTTVVICGQDFARVRYGDDHVNARERCHDCGCEHGEIHYWGCDVEICPRCRGQMLTCICPEGH